MTESNGIVPETQDDGSDKEENEDDKEEDDAHEASVLRV